MKIEETLIKNLVEFEITQEFSHHFVYIINDIRHS